MVTTSQFWSLSIFKKHSLHLENEYQVERLNWNKNKTMALSLVT